MILLYELGILLVARGKRGPLAEISG
jgi:hypothetical protein